MKLLRKLRRIFRFKRKSETLKLCPRCNSPKMRLATRYSGWLTPETSVCEECGYSGPIYLEIDLDVNSGKGFEKAGNNKEAK